MREFLRPIRRKVAASLLILACIFLCGWLRAGFVEEAISFRSRESIIVGASNRAQGICWTPCVPYDTNSGPKDGKWSVEQIDATDILQEDWCDGRDIVWRWQLCGFDFGECNEEHYIAQFLFWRISHWSLVAPLTLLSAWLLLSTPRVLLKNIEQTKDRNHRHDEDKNSSDV